MRKIITTILVALIPLMGFSLEKQQPRIYDVQRTAQKIRIDGKLNEQAWQHAAASDCFADIRGEEYPAPLKKTSVKMLWDDEYLYIAATLEEDNITASVTRRDDIVYHDNDFEVFLDPFCDGQLYFELETNAFGTVMDLLMTKPYSKGGKFIMDWDYKGLKLATRCNGTVNNPSDKDKAWHVEMAIPFSSLNREFRNARENKVWRFNLSRVEWPVKDGPEENWVWAPTGKVDIHVPELWGYLRFCDGDVVPSLPAGKIVKNWMWERLKLDRSDEDYTAHFKKAHDCGISGILFEGYDERIFRLCKEAGLEAHYWLWTLNRNDLLQEHPDWGVVNRKGESSYDNPPYVDYYRFLCPNHEGVAETVAADYVRCANLKYVDGMHLDYVRFPDVVLPVSLWKNYGIDQTTELPEYDFCYCDVCREKFKALTGRDPLELEYPQEDQSWINFRLDAITDAVKVIYDAMQTTGKPLSAAVFPGPSMARKMVRQDWGNWPLKAYFPMIYNGFYNEGPEWIGRSVAESVKAVAGNAAIYAGLFYPDIKGDDFIKALDAAFDNGASGVSFFDGPTDEGLEIFCKYLQDRGYATEK